MKGWIALIALSLVVLPSGAHSPTTPAWSKSAWISEALLALQSGRYPRVKAVSYWHERWQHEDGVVSDLRVNSSPEALRAYRSLTANPWFTTAPQFDLGSQKLLPPLWGMYLSAFPDFGGTEDQVNPSRIRAYESLVGKPITWAYFSNNWYDEIRFPRNEVQRIWNSGRIPFVRLMMRSRSGAVPDPVYNLTHLLEGELDEALYQWAEDAKAASIPLILEFGTEANGDWFPWNGVWNGGKKTDEFYDGALADGPERFQYAYRHIVRIFREVGVKSVTWVFHVNAESVPNEPWNEIQNYYPGEDYVDWIGVSVYGPVRPQHEPFETFTSVMDRTYPVLTALSPEKPIAVLEWGISENTLEGRAAP